MYPKFLFIGLGGSGGKTLRVLKQEIRRWMDEHGVGGKVPDGWQFLHIDTPTTPDADGRAPQLAPNEYLGLIDAGVGLPALQAMLDGNIALQDSLATWRVEPAGIAVPLAAGAGQMRAIGQSVATAYAQQIRSRIESAASAAALPGVHAELAEVFAAANGKAAGKDSPTYVVVISSLAGGTGAGLLMMVCDIMRALKIGGGDKTIGVLYTPEVFRSLGGAAAGGVQPNSMAALCEMQNGRWWHGGAGGAAMTKPALVAAGMPAPLESGGPSFPFLVGGTNPNGISFGTPDDLFEMVGRSLLPWVTNVDVQSRFIAYTIANWHSAALERQQLEGVLVEQGDMDERGLPCFSALGFARLSVGADHFERYFAQRLIKHAVVHLARFHTDSDEAVAAAKALEGNDPAVLADHLAGNRRTGFLRAMRLTELGPDDNEIIDALRPDSDPVLAAAFDEQVRTLASAVPGVVHSGAEWQHQIASAIPAAREHTEAEYQAATSAAAAAWVPEAQQRLVAEVRDLVAECGLRVAAAVCEQTAAYLAREVAPGLIDNDLQQAQAYAEQAVLMVGDKLKGVGKKAKHDSPQVQEALRVGIDTAAWGRHAILCAAAAEVAKEFAVRALTPMAETLMDAHEAANQDLAATAAYPNMDDAAPPSAIRPPAGDYPLLDPDDWPARCDALIDADIHAEGIAAGTIDKLDKLRRDLISGSFLDNAPDSGSAARPAVEVVKNWVPTPAPVFAHVSAPANLGIRLNMSLGHLNERARAWMHVPGSATGKFLEQSLRSFVGVPDAVGKMEISPSEAQKRRARLIAQLNASIAGAAPLIGIDEGLWGQVHGDSNEPRLHLSEIPFAAHPIEDDVRGVLAAHGVPKADIDAAMNMEAASRIDISSTLPKPVSLLTVRSLMEPMGKAWFAAVSAGTMAKKNFWAYRRATTLDMFVPVPQALLRCMVRGWWTGRMLGLVSDGSDGPPTIWCPGTGARQRFADDDLPPPGKASDLRDALPRVLEALPLAYAASSVNGSLASLRPYIALRDLGRSELHGSLRAYDSLPDVFDAWIGHGAVAEGATRDGMLLMRMCEQDRGGDTDMPPYARGQYIVRFCNEAIAGFEAEFEFWQKEWRANPARLSVAPLWTGLWQSHIRPALNEIRGAADSHERGAVGGMLV